MRASVQLLTQPHTYIRAHTWATLSTTATRTHCARRTRRYFIIILLRMNAYTIVIIVIYFFQALLCYCCNKLLFLLYFLQRALRFTFFLLLKKFFINNDFPLTIDWFFNTIAPMSLKSLPIPSNAWRWPPALVAQQEQQRHKQALSRQWVHFSCYLVRKQ